MKTILLFLLTITAACAQPALWNDYQVGQTFESVLAQTQGRGHPQKAPGGETIVINNYPGSGTVFTITFIFGPKKTLREIIMRAPPAPTMQQAAVFQKLSGAVTFKYGTETKHTRNESLTQVTWVKDGTMVLLNLNRMGGSSQLYITYRPAPQT